MKNNLVTTTSNLRKFIRSFENENLPSSYKINVCYYQLKKTLKELKDFEEELQKIIDKGHPDYWMSEHRTLEMFCKEFLKE